MSSKKQRREPRKIKVFCLTGTPGTGKTTICGLVKEHLDTDDYLFINVGDLIKEKKLYTEWDDDMNCSIFDEDALGAELKRTIKKADKEGKKGILIDFHSIGFIPRKLVDNVIVVRTETNLLWERLAKRGYKEAKIKENLEAEIFMESYNEAIDQFDEDIVGQRDNNTEDDMSATVKHIVDLFSQ
jgi:adenylate kinase